MRFQSLSFGRDAGVLGSRDSLALMRTRHPLLDEPDRGPDGRFGVYGHGHDVRHRRRPVAPPERR